MPIYAITPDGKILCFLDAKFVYRCEDHCDLFTSRDGRFIARVPGDWLTSMTKPVLMECSGGNITLESAARIVAAGVQDIKPSNRWTEDFRTLEKLKRKLNNFNLRTCCWKRGSNG